MHCRLSKWAPDEQDRHLTVRTGEKVAPSCHCNHFIINQVFYYLLVRQRQNLLSQHNFTSKLCDVPMLEVSTTFKVSISVQWHMLIKMTASCSWQPLRGMDQVPLLKTLYRNSWYTCEPAFAIILGMFPHPGNSDLPSIQLEKVISKFCET